MNRNLIVVGTTGSVFNNVAGLNTSKVVYVNIMSKDEPYGLCNQLGYLSGYLRYACIVGGYVSFPFINSDAMNSTEAALIPLSSVLDIQETNKALGCTRIISHDSIGDFASAIALSSEQLGREDMPGGWHEHYYKYFRFSDELNWVPEFSHGDIRTTLPEEYYGLHFRFETDALLCILGDSWCSWQYYRAWLSLHKNNRKKKKWNF